MGLEPYLDKKDLSFQLSAISFQWDFTFDRPADAGLGLFRGRWLKPLPVKEGFGPSVLGYYHRPSGNGVAWRMVVNWVRHDEILYSVLSLSQERDTQIFEEGENLWRLTGVDADGKHSGT